MISLLKILMDLCAVKYYIDDIETEKIFVVIVYSLLILQTYWKDILMIILKSLTNK